MNNGRSIFLLVRSLEAGGAERQLAELARGLHQRGHKVVVAAFYKRGPLLNDLEQAGVTVVDLGKGGRWDLVGFLARTAFVVRRIRPDVLYSFLGGANVVAAALRPLVPPMKIVWSIRSSNMDLSRYDWLHGVTYWMECRLSRTADLIIANSVAGRDFAVGNGFPGDRIRIVPNGIDVERFRPDPDLRRRQRVEWGLSDRHIAVGVLARLDPMKGHRDLLDAAAGLAGRAPNFRFLAIGAGPEEEDLKRHSAELGLADRVRFTGPIERPEAALNALDIYCSPSVTEGFSNSVAEAMACGVPCVVTGVGDSAAIVGETGAVVPPSNPEALGQALLSLAARLEDGRGKAVRERVVEFYSVDSMIDRTIAALA